MRTALVLGGSGFIGRHVVAALEGAGWRVVRVVRPRGGEPEGVCAVDLAHATGASQWEARLAGVDAVVNCAGLLRERGADRFETLHVKMPQALAEACRARGIRRFVQISALGHPDDGEFIASKHRGDRVVLDQLPEALVLRPSVICGLSGSYGGTSLLRALAALPGGLVLPGHGQWRMQPMLVEDLAQLVVAGLAGEVRGVHEVGGPQAMTLHQYLAHWRHWLELPTGGVLHVPEIVVDVAARCGEWLGRGPLGLAVWRMMKRGNVLAAPLDEAAFGFQVRAIDEALAARPSHVQDRWHARLYLLGPLLSAMLVLLWLISAWVGFVTPAAVIERMAAGGPTAEWPLVAMARGAGALDLIVGLWLASGWRPRHALLVMGAMVLAYTFVFGLFQPGQWFDPLGGLAKNLVVLPAIAIAWVLVDRR